jgi:hypothetical protein
MSKVVGGVIITFVVALAAGLIVAAIQSGVFEPAFRNASPQQPAQDSSQSSGTSPSSVPTETVSTPQPVVAPPVVITPAPLDNKIITQAQVMVVGSKISPTVYRRQAPPGYYASVFTAAGQVEYSDGCYVHWQLYNNGTLLTTDDSKCGLAGGWSTTWWPNDTALTAGSVRVTGSITTDWGATGNAEADFTVQ